MKSPTPAEVAASLRLCRCLRVLEIIGPAVVHNPPQLKLVSAETWLPRLTALISLELARLDLSGSASLQNTLQGPPRLSRLFCTDVKTHQHWLRLAQLPQLTYLWLHKLQLH